MAFIFMQDSDGWGTYRLVGDEMYLVLRGEDGGLGLQVTPKPPNQTKRNDTGKPWPARLVRRRARELQRGSNSDKSQLLLVASQEFGGADSWALIGKPASFSASGLRCDTGLHVLHGHVEIGFEGLRCFFSDEAVAEVVDFDGDHGAVCPRCKSGIERGQKCVACVHCRISYHQSEDRSCYGYGPTCVTCGVKTSLGGDPEWSPEDD